MPADWSRHGPETWIGIDDSARYLSVPVRTMYRLAQRGQLPAVKVGRTWRFKRSALDEHLRTRQAGAPPRTAGEAPSVTEARRWSQQLERIEALSRRLSRSRDVASVADAVASEIASVIDWHGLRFFIAARDGQTLQEIVLRSTVPHYDRGQESLLQVQIGQGLAGHVAAS